MTIEFVVNSNTFWCIFYFVYDHMLLCRCAVCTHMRNAHGAQSKCEYSQNHCISRMVFVDAIDDCFEYDYIFERLVVSVRCLYVHTLFLLHQLRRASTDICWFLCNTIYMYILCYDVVIFVKLLMCIVFIISLLHLGHQLYWNFFEVFFSLCFGCVSFRLLQTKWHCTLLYALFIVCAVIFL